MIKLFVQQYGIRVIIPIVGIPTLLKVLSSNCDMRVKDFAIVLGLCQGAVASQIMLVLLMYFFV